MFKRSKPDGDEEVNGGHIHDSEENDVKRGRMALVEVKQQSSAVIVSNNPLDKVENLSFKNNYFPFNKSLKYFHVKFINIYV
jgi:hypothetical protein